MNAAAQVELVSLLERGDAYASCGDSRAATCFYQAALKQAQGCGSLNAQLMPRLQQAQAFVQNAVNTFRSALERAVDENRPENAAAALRMQHMLDMLTGERKVHLQEPAVLYYPYLAQRQFFEREEFDWVAELEASTDDIRDELLALLDTGADFRPYVQNDPNRPVRDFAGLNESTSWTALYLWQDGRMVHENASRCPKTMAAIERIPLSDIGARTPAVLFSRLQPGAHIPPHHGMLNCRLICHLPLVVPEGCWLRVGNERRELQPGKMLIFDDSFEHEAMNPSEEVRIILLFDVWRPELGAKERAAISAIFKAIDEFKGLPDA